MDFTDLKKEDEEYINSQINKENKIDKFNFFKKLDQNLTFWSAFFLILGVIVGILSSSIGGAISAVGIILSIFLMVFSSVYLIWSFLFWVVGLISKKSRENYKFKVIAKSILATVIAILIIVNVLMMPICGLSGCTPVKPTTVTTTLLTNQINNPGAENCTDPVTFNRSKSTLSAEAITQDTGLSSKQVVFANPYEIANFDAISPSQLKYEGTSSKRVLMCIICSDNGKTGLESAIVQNGINTPINSTTEGETLCLIYPRKTS